MWLATGGNLAMAFDITNLMANNLKYSIGSNTDLREAIATVETDSNDTHCLDRIIVENVKEYLDHESHKSKSGCQTKETQKLSTCLTPYCVPHRHRHLRPLTRCRAGSWRIDLAGSVQLLRHLPAGGRWEGAPHLRRPMPCPVPLKACLTGAQAHGCGCSLKVVLHVYNAGEVTLQQQPASSQAKHAASSPSLKRASRLQRSDQLP